MTLVIAKPFPARYRSGGAGNARPGNPSEWELNSSGSAIGSFALLLATSEMGIGSGDVHVRSPLDRQCWHWFSWNDRVGASFGSVLNIYCRARRRRKRYKDERDRRLTAGSKVDLAGWETIRASFVRWRKGGAVTVDKTG